jgi:hypothetical protein
MRKLICQIKAAATTIMSFNDSLQITSSQKDVSGANDPVPKVEATHEPSNEKAASGHVNAPAPNPPNPQEESAKRKEEAARLKQEADPSQQLQQQQQQLQQQLQQLQQLQQQRMLQQLQQQPRGTDPTPTPTHKELMDKLKKYFADNLQAQKADPATTQIQPPFAKSPLGIKLTMEAKNDPKLLARLKKAYQDGNNKIIQLQQTQLNQNIEWGNNQVALQIMAAIEAYTQELAREVKEDEVEEDYENDQSFSADSGQQNSSPRSNEHAASDMQSKSAEGRTNDQGQGGSSEFEAYGNSTKKERGSVVNDIAKGKKVKDVAQVLHNKIPIPRPIKN